MSSNRRPIWVNALLDRSLSAVEFRTWTLIYRYQGGNESAWPSQKKLADDLGLTEDGIRKITHRLAAKGWLRIIHPDHTAPGQRVQYKVASPENHPDGCLGEHPDGEQGVSPNHPDSEAAPYKKK